MKSIASTLSSLLFGACLLSFGAGIPAFLLHAEDKAPSGFTNAAPSTPPAVTLLPLNDNSAPPFKAVYRWGQSGCVHGHYDEYGPWLNRTVIWAEDFMPTDSWDNLEGQQWQLGTFEPWVQKQAGRRYVLSLPLLVGGWDGKGPERGQNAHIPVSLEQGAEGKYNVHFQRLAESLVKHNLANTIIRVGWEFNGGWYSWRANNAKKAEAFAAYFRQVVTTMRAVPGAGSLKFAWNPAMEPYWAYPPEKAWPGDDVVDYVGLDVYDQCWAKDTYPIPADATDDERLARQRRTWENITNNEKANGLPFWTKFAASHHKPLVIPEWGLCIRKDKHGGGDNVLFIENMFNFIHNPANNVYFECYFDVTAGDGDHQLVPDPAGKRPTMFPKSAEKYKELFTLPPAAKAPVTPVAPLPAPTPPAA